MHRGIRPFPFVVALLLGVGLAFPVWAGPCVQPGEREYHLQEPAPKKPPGEEASYQDTAFRNTAGVYILKGMDGMAAFTVQGKYRVVKLRFEQPNSIQGFDDAFRPDLHKGVVYAVPNSPTRLFFSRTGVGFRDGHTVYPLYLSLDGKTYRRLLTYSGTYLVGPRRPSGLAIVPYIRVWGIRIPGVAEVGGMEYPGGGCD
jgi:hypothetical protein